VAGENWSRKRNLGKKVFGFATESMFTKPTEMQMLPPSAVECSHAAARIPWFLISTKSFFSKANFASF
jgi:hypothetical protein